MTDIDTELERRLKALRSRAAQPKPLPSHEDAAARLAALEPPSDAETSRDVPIEVKGVDDEVARLLAAVSPTAGPSTQASNDRRLNAALKELEEVAPRPFASPIEVSFAGPPPPGARSLRTEDEDEALIGLLQDELSVEETVQRRGGGAEGGIAGLESRLRQIREFKSADGSGNREPTAEEKAGAELGKPPAPAELDDFRKVKRRTLNDDASEDSDESSSESDATDDDSEED